VGSYAGYSNIGGLDNSFVGDHAGYFNTQGIGNSFMELMPPFQHRGLFELLRWIRSR